MRSEPEISPESSELDRLKTALQERQRALHEAEIGV